MWIKNKDQKPTINDSYVVFACGKKFIAKWDSKIGWISNISENIEYWFDLQFLLNPAEEQFMANTIQLCSQCSSVIVESDKISTINAKENFDNLEFCKNCNQAMPITSVIYTCDCGCSETEKIIF